MAANQFWYADSNGVTCGPFDGKQLKQLAATGIITAETQVYAAHTQKWVPARRVKGLLPTIAVQPSRPPPVPALPQSIPARKKPTLSNTQIACFCALFVLCLGLYSGLGTPNEGPRPNGQRVKEPDSVPEHNPEYVVFTASQVYAYYDQNEVRGDRELKDKTFAVRGTVDEINKEILGRPYVSFRSNNWIFGVQCLFPHTAEHKLAKLLPGDTVTIVGKCSGKFGNVLMEECRLHSE